MNTTIRFIKGQTVVFTITVEHLISEITSFVVNLRSLSSDKLLYKGVLPGNLTISSETKTICVEVSAETTLNAENDKYNLVYEYVKNGKVYKCLVEKYCEFKEVKIND